MSSMNIGLVLSGGMVKGAYQAGVLKALSDQFCLSVKHISASSVGVLNSYAFATNKINFLEDVWKNIVCYSGCSSIVSLLKGPYLKKMINEIANGQESIVSSSMFISLLNVTNLTIKSSSGANLEYVDLKKVGSDAIRHYLQASVNLPIVSKPLEVFGKKYYDGGLADNMPIAPLIGLETDFVICVYFDDYNYYFGNEELNRRAIKLNFPRDDSNKNMFCLDQGRINAMFDEGYYECKTTLGNIFGIENTSKEEICNRITALNEKNTLEVCHVGIDYYARHLNRAVMRLARNRKVII